MFSSLPVHNVGFTHNKCVRERYSPVVGKNWTNNPPYLGNSARCYLSYINVIHAGEFAYWLSIGTENVGLE